MRRRSCIVALSLLSPSFRSSSGQPRLANSARWRAEDCDPSSATGSASRAVMRSGVVRKASLSRFDQASSTSCARLPTIRTTASSLPRRTRSVLTPNHCAHAVPTKSGGKPALVTCRSLLIEMPAERVPVEAVHSTIRSSASQPRSRPCHCKRSILPKSTPSVLVPARRSRRKRAPMRFSLRKPVPAVS